MMHSSYWPWWLGALALATVAVGFWLAAGRLLGVSGSFSRAIEGPGSDDAGALPVRSPWIGHVTLLGGVVLGGLLGSVSRGAFHLRLGLGNEFAHVVGGGWRGFGALVLGGALVGFGTAMAGGCTSGHGLCGTSRLQRGSIVATASFFGAAVAVSLALARLS